MGQHHPREDRRIRFLHEHGRLVDPGVHSHIKNMRDTLSKDESIGRKLDFLAQEMNREANTILSKANDMKLSADAIDLKTEIEKIREQIQNIE